LAGATATEWNAAAKRAVPEAVELKVEEIGAALLELSLQASSV